MSWSRATFWFVVAVGALLWTYILVHGARQGSWPRRRGASRRKGVLPAPSSIATRSWSIHEPPTRGIP